MVAIDTHVDPSDAVFAANRERMQQLVAELRERTKAARLGGGQKYLDRHREQGKLPVR
jgi:acetyl-CoA carboxylase carboxyltransferase component